jgi:Protein of unknown function (DUF3168)
MPLQDASLPLQKALVAKLKSDPAVASIINGRIYDAVPAGATKPYVSLGPFQVLPEDADCSEGGEVFVTLDGWAAGPDTVGVKRLGAAIAKALHFAEMTLDEGQRLVILSLEQLQYLRDPDNITAHAIVTLRAQTEPIP